MSDVKIVNQLVYIVFCGFWKYQLQKL